MSALEKPSIIQNTGITEKVLFSPTLPLKALKYNIFVLFRSKQLDYVVFGLFLFPAYVFCLYTLKLLVAKVVLYNENQV
jgi:hypothetical protein